VNGDWPQHDNLRVCLSDWSLLRQGGAVRHARRKRLGGLAVSRFLSYVRQHHVALLALFVAMGGTSYAAFKLPNNSVGSKQIKANAVNSSKVASGSLLKGDFKAGQLPAGPQGLKGDKGDPCLASDPNCKGPKGDAGPQGPGALSFDGQFPADNTRRDIALVNGIRVAASCSTNSNPLELQVTAVDVAQSFYAWGTDSIDGGSPTEVHLSSAPQVPQYIDVIAGNRAELDIVARATAPGAAVKWTRIDLLGIKGNSCNYHALIIPPS
jgi:hypothetical protein